MTPWMQQTLGCFADREDGQPVYVGDHVERPAKLWSTAGFPGAWVEARRIPDLREPRAYAARGVFIERARFGYTVVVDGRALPLELSWSNADGLAHVIARLRGPGDGRGYARCRHPGNDVCFRAGVCVYRAVAA